MKLQGSIIFLQYTRMNFNFPENQISRGYINIFNVIIIYDQTVFSMHLQLHN